MLAAVDEEMLDAVRHLVGQSFRAADIDEATLAGLRTPDIASVIAAVARRAAELDIDSRVTVRHGPLIPTLADFANNEPCLLIVGCGAECGASSYQRALALIRESANPILVV